MKTEYILTTYLRYSLAAKLRSCKEMSTVFLFKEGRIYQKIQAKGIIEYVYILGLINEKSKINLINWIDNWKCEYVSNPTNKKIDELINLQFKENIFNKT